MNILPSVSVYVDESGDLGFKSTSSKFFSIGYVFTINRHPFLEKKIVERTLKRINSKKNQKQKIPEFKFSNDSEKTRKKFLNVIKKMDIVVGAVCIRKDSVRADLKDDPDFLYRYLVVDSIITVLVQNYFQIQDHYNSVKFVIDRRLSKLSIIAFNKYCEDKTSFRTWEVSIHMDYHVTIAHENSQAVKMLQIADYIAGAIQQKFERGISIYYEIISDKIKHTREWDNNNEINW